MKSWYGFGILSLFFMGIQRFLYKVSAERKCNSAWTTLCFMTTVALLSSVFFMVSKQSVLNTQFLFFIAFLNSIAFFVGTITHIEALKRIPASVAYSIIRLNIVIVVIFSILFFNDRLSVYQTVGILFAIAGIVILTKEPEDKEMPCQNIRRGFIFVSISMLAGAIAAISSKFAVIHTNKIAFMAISYLISASFSFGIRKKLQTEGANTNRRDAVIIGFAMGITNFIGYYLFLKALSIGPLSIIASITSMHFVPAIIFSVLIYKEKLTPSRVFGILLTIFSIILVRH